MKFKLLMTLGISLVCTQIQATHFFALQHEKEGKVFHNHLSELNSQDGKELSIVKLQNSYKFGVEKLALPESPYMFLYGLVDKDKANLHIVDKQDISNIKTITLDHIHNRLLTQYQLYSFYYLTEDQSHLMIHSGFKKNQNLMVIDVANGSVVKKIPLSKFKNEVSVSTDEQYLLINNTSRDELTIINANTFETALSSQLGDYRKFGIIHNHHLYLTKFKGKKHNRVYWSQVIDLKTKQKTNFTDEGASEPIYTVDETNNKLYSLRTAKNKKSVTLSELNGSTTTDLSTFKMKIVPEEMHIDDQFNRLLLRGKGKVATISMDNFEQYALTKLPFDTVNYIYSKNGELLYLKEGSGSEVAVVNVKSGDLIERSGTGRQGVKFGQFMASVALAGVGANFGYMVYFAKYSNTGFTLNHKEDKLYVINSKTNDVTHLNANDLSDRKAIATGRGTFLVHQGNDTHAPLWVFSGKQISQINDQSFEMQKEIEYKDIIGFNKDEDYFIIKTEQDILTYDMKTGDIINQWPMSNADFIWTEK